MNDLQNTEQDAKALLANIENALGDINKDIEETDRHALETLQHVETKVDATTAEIAVIFDEVECAEKQTEEALDILILGQLDEE